MNFQIVEQIANHIADYFGKSNKRMRRLRRIEKKARRGFRQFVGYRLNPNDSLTNEQLEQVFQPDDQSASEVYTKLLSLDKNFRYTQLLLWCWAAEFGQPFQFVDPPQIQ